MAPRLGRLRAEAQLETKDEILHKIRHADSMYRLFLMLLVLIVVAGIGVSLFAQFRILAGIARNEQERTSQLQEMNRHLDCVVRYFSLPAEERQKVHIQDIDHCSLSPVDDHSLSNQSTSSTTSTGTQHSSSQAVSTAQTPTTSSAPVQGSTAALQQPNASPVPQPHGQPTGGTPSFLAPLAPTVCSLQPAVPLTNGVGLTTC